MRVPRGHRRNDLSPIKGIGIASETSSVLFRRKKLKTKVIRIRKSDPDRALETIISIPEIVLFGIKHMA